MNDSGNKYLIGVGYLVTNVESYIIRKLIYLYKLLKIYSNLLFLRLHEILEFVFNMENRKTTLVTIIISIIIIKIFQIMNFLIKVSRGKKTEINLKEKEIDVSLKENFKDKYDQEDLDHTETNKILMTYTSMLENKQKKILKGNLKKINELLEIQNKMRDKLDLPKESINSPFYNILKLYINDNLNKN